MGFYILSIVLLLILYALIWVTKWAIRNVVFSEDLKIQRIIEVVMKVISWGLLGLFVYVALTTLGILLAPLFTRINAAFSAAVSAFFGFLEELIPYVVLCGIGYFWWREKHPKSLPISDRTIAAEDVEKAEQEAQDIHGDIGELVYNASVDTAKVKRDLIVCPDDCFGMETGRDKAYRMDEDMAIHQFILDTPTAPLTKDMEAAIMQELQRHINQRSRRYPHLCRNGYAPIVYDVRDAGGFVTVEVVLYAEKYMDKVKARYSTHFGRQLSYKSVASAEDPLFKQ